MLLVLFPQEYNSTDFLDPWYNLIWYCPILKSNVDTLVKPSSFSSISPVFGIEIGFLQILWFIFLKLDKNITVISHFLKWRWGFPTLIYLLSYLTLVGKTTFPGDWYLRACSNKTTYVTWKKFHSNFAHFLHVVSSHFLFWIGSHSSSQADKFSAISSPALSITNWCSWLFYRHHPQL